MPKISKKKTTALPQEPKVRFPKIDKRFLIILVGIILVFLVVYAAKSLFIVALVNGQPISRLAVIRQLEEQSGGEVSQTIITQTLIRQEAKKKGIVVANEQIDSRIKSVEDQVASQGGNLDQMLADRGQTKEDLRDQAQVQILIEALLKDTIQVSDQEIAEYFEKNQDTLKKGAKLEEVKAEIDAQLREEKLFQAFQTWMEDLRKNAKIIYFKTY